MLDDSIKPVTPVCPVAPYLGGKRNLSRRRCDLIAIIPHHTYVERLVGMGGVFLRPTLRPRAEVINDISTDVTNMFRVARRHYEPLVEELAAMPASRDEFERLRRVESSTLTNIEHAARFLYHQRLGVWSQRLMVQQPRASGRKRYGPGSTRERHDDRGRPSSDTA